MSIDLNTLWDFAKPELSEQRFRAALPAAQGDDVLVLQTQIARSLGLRRQFTQARTLLQSLEPQAKTAGFEARVRWALEMGRSYASAAHPAELATAEWKAQARQYYEQALATARQGQLDGLAIDAIHMLAFVDTAPADQLKWAQQALDVVQASQQPAARRWEASIRNNLGYALHQLGRYPEALAQFEQALQIRRQGSNAEAARSAQWMVAWTLRALKRDSEALAMQLRLEAECEAAGQPDRYVFEELETLYTALGNVERASHYTAKKKSAGA
jgi:tetratricopeptide (TPR) repeat protein